MDRTRVKGKHSALFHVIIQVIAIETGAASPYKHRVSH